MIFSDVSHTFTTYLSSVRGLSPQTERSYSSDLRSFNVWCEQQGVDPFNCSHRILRMYLSHLVNAEYARTTIARKIACLRAFYLYVNEQGIMDNNPTLLLSSPKLPKRLPKALPDTQRDALLETPHEGTPLDMRDAAILELLYASGMRVAELCALKLGDVEFTQGTAVVTGKGSKQRVVPIHPLALKKIESWIKEVRPQYDSKHLPYVFLSSRGNALSTDSVRRIVKKAAKMAGVEVAVTPHTLRHTFATDLLNEGVDLRTVQELLGHATLSTTQIYTHMSNQKLKEVFKQTHPRG